MSATPIARLALAREQMAALKQAAEAAYPNEFCALLIGHDGPGGAVAVSRIVPADNVDPEPGRGFELDPRVLFKTMRELRESGSAERLVGHAHSHPDAPARPSARDAAQAHEPGLVWLIVPVRKGKAGVARAFLAEAGVGSGVESGAESGTGPGAGAAGEGPSVFRPVRLERPRGA